MRQDLFKISLFWSVRYIRNDPYRFFNRTQIFSKKKNNRAVFKGKIFSPLVVSAILRRIFIEGSPPLFSPSSRRVYPTVSSKRVPFERPLLVDHDEPVKCRTLARCLSTIVYPHGYVARCYRFRIPSSGAQWTFAFPGISGPVEDNWTGFFSFFSPKSFPLDSFRCVLIHRVDVDARSSVSAVFGLF